MARPRSTVWPRLRFDLVLMDMQMPVVDGFEALRTLRAREEGSGRRTPVIAMTALSMEGDRDRCLRAGADAYLSKPFSRHSLLDAIESVLTAFPLWRKLRSCPKPSSRSRPRRRRRR